MAKRQRRRASKARRRGPRLVGVKLKDELERDVREVSSSIDAAPSPAASPPAEPWQPPVLPRETRETLVQAMILFSASSLRHYAGLVETIGRHVPDLARSLTGDGMSDEEGAERLRACLREVADLSIEEARRVRVQLERLDSQAGSAAPPEDGTYWRRWKAKL